MCHRVMNTVVIENKYDVTAFLSIWFIKTSSFAIDANGATVFWP